MPKKKNFLGGMQNYDPKTGEYESSLTTASGEQATPENVPGGERKLSLKIPTKKMTKKLYNKEVKEMFGSKEEALKYIEENFEEGPGKENAIRRVEQAFPEEIKGETTPSYYNGIGDYLKSKGGVTEQKIGDTIRKNKIDMDYGQLYDIVDIVLASNNPKVELQNVIIALKGASKKSVQRWIDSKKGKK